MDLWLCVGFGESVEELFRVYTAQQDVARIVYCLVSLIV
jgi:hypothetical protein